MCGGTHGSPWDSIGMSYVGQSCVGWWILLANLDMSEKARKKIAFLTFRDRVTDRVIINAHFQSLSAIQSMLEVPSHDSRLNFAALAACNPSSSCNFLFDFGASLERHSQTTKRQRDRESSIRGNHVVKCDDVIGRLIF